VAISRPPSHGVSYPSTTSKTVSDLHQSYLLWLCCVLRLSQPLDALFHPLLSGLVSYRYRPGFYLQSVPLTDSLARLATRSIPHVVSQLLLADESLQLQGFMHSASPFRVVRCYPVTCGRSSRGICPFKVFLTSSRPPCGSLLSWASACRCARTEVVVHRHACSAEFQRTKRVDRTLSSSPPLRGVFNP